MVRARTTDSSKQPEKKNPMLVALGERVRKLRNQRGVSRMALSKVAGISERHLANLEYGAGNPSLLVLGQLAEALACSLAELLGDMTTASKEWMAIRGLLEGRDKTTLLQAKVALQEMLGEVKENDSVAHRRVALIGLRGAGKSTLGRMLAEKMTLPFVEISREIEALAGCSIAEIQALYGISAYRRYEKRALEQTMALYPEAIIATPGGLVSDPGNFGLLRGAYRTIWLKAAPRDHMQRVIDQGDLRPMAGNNEAMADLKEILATRSSFYGSANYSLNTSDQSLEQTFILLKQLVEAALGE